MKAQTHVWVALRGAGNDAQRRFTCVWGSPSLPSRPRSLSLLVTRPG